MSGPTRRLAIVGGGPRAVYALEALARRALRAHGGGHRPDDDAMAPDGSARPHLPELIDVYEPRPHLGTGMAYHLDQPDWVSLNIPDHALNAAEVHTGTGLTASPLASPFASDPPVEGGDTYPSRAAAGAYLAALADRAIAALAPTEVRHLRHRVRRVDHHEGGLRVHAGPASTDYDAVLLVTGHSETWPGLDLPSGVPAVRVFPITDLVATAQQLRPERVQVRGAHLSAIDAVLALSEGLGGRFVGAAEPPTPQSTAGLPTPATAPPASEDRLRYHPGDLDPVITITSRTGRLMLAKTDAAVLRRYRSEQVAAPFLPQVRTTTDLTVLLERLAAEILTQARRTWDPRSAVVHPEEIRPVWDTLTGPVTTDPFGELQRSLAYARGRAAPDETWALGQAWRHAYVDLVGRQRTFARRVAGGQQVPPLDWPDYPHLVTGLDRLAFGPPPGNAAKLLTLAEAGRLHLLRTADLPAAPPDLIVDAVTAPPGLPSGDELWDQLLTDGLVHRGPTRRSVLTDAAGSCLTADGASNGLAAVGRMTEDLVIGTDTLLRSMHPELELWADRIVGDTSSHR